MSIFDIALVLIFAVIVIVSAKKGFVKSVSGIIAWALAAVLAIGLCTTVSDMIYETVLKDIVINTIDERINIEDEAVQAADAVSEVIVNLPEFVVNAAESVGVDVESIEQKTKNFTVDERGIAAALEESAVGPIVRGATKAVVFILIFVLLSALLTVLLNPVSKLIGKIPVIKQANTLLGVLLGIIKAVILIIVLAMICELAFGFSENEFSKAVEQSQIIKLIVESRITDTLFS